MPSRLIRMIARSTPAATPSEMCWTRNCGSGSNPARNLPDGANVATGNPGGFFPCQNYAQQLFWLYDQNLDAPDVGNNSPPVYNNFDLTYQHQFRNAFGMRATAYFKRGYDVPANALISQTLDPNTGIATTSVFSVSNVGINKTTGVELLLTKDQQFGFSGQLALTYINELSNVVPLPGAGLEDFFPPIPQASRNLGNVYRVGYLSPFQGVLSMQYKTRSGWRINPTIFYNHGYPTGVGTLTAANVNSKSMIVPNTNITIPAKMGGTSGAYDYVVPQNPGTIFNPNVAATRGTPGTVVVPGVGGVFELSDAGAFGALDSRHSVLPSSG